MFSFQRTKAQRNSVLIMLLVSILMVLLPFLSSAEDNIPEAGIRNPVVRVLLSRMNLTDRLDLTLVSPYMLVSPKGADVYLRPGSEVSFLLRNDQIFMHFENLTLQVGSSVTLLRTGEGGESVTGFYRTHFPELYMGDLQMNSVDGKLRPILSIHVEDYLLGVIPHEMSESFPVEALKAQAIAARTYAMRRQSSTRDYDVVDTTNDQVFKGYVPGNVRCEQAISETKGICGFYKGKLAQCYYSASNGGQMELVETVWDTDDDYGYYRFGRDPYDVENPESVVRSFEIQKVYNTEAPYVFRKLIAEQLAAFLTERGYEPAAEMIRIDRVESLALKDPQKTDSLLYNMLEIRLNISVRSTYEAMQLMDPDMEEVSLFQPYVMPTAACTSEPEDLPHYGPFVPVPELITVNIPIFPDAEYALGMDISGNFDNEIWSIAEKENGYVLQARRYGHGVGMSQRGAQQMAARYDKTYQDILRFYYPGLELMRFEAQPTVYPVVEDGLLETAGPAASPTPRPTLMPLTLNAENGQWIALVTEIDDNSSLNLRTEPNLSSEIRMRLYKNQRLLVVERCLQEGWVKVKTDVTEGFVMEKYLTREP